MKAPKVGDKLFSWSIGHCMVEAVRGKGKDAEFMITVCDEEHWIPVSKITS